MRCHDCLKPIASGAEADKRIETRAVTVYAPPTGEPVPTPFGVGMAAGPLSAGEGWPLLYVEHSKCYHSRTRAQARQASKLAERQADPGFTEHEARDWREPVTMDLEELLPDESDGSAG